MELHFHQEYFKNHKNQTKKWNKKKEQKAG